MQRSIDHIKGLLLNDSKTSDVEKKNAFLEKEIKGIGEKNCCAKFF
jgi:hypothetical protein